MLANTVIKIETLCVHGRCTHNKIRKKIRIYYLVQKRRQAVFVSFVGRGRAQLGRDDAKENRARCVADEHGVEDALAVRFCRLLHEITDDDGANIAHHVAYEKKDRDGGAPHVDWDSVLNDRDGRSEPALCEKVLKKVKRDCSVKVCGIHNADKRKKSESGAKAREPRTPSHVALSERVGELAADKSRERASSG